MADTKLTALTANTTPVDADLFYIVDDPGGSPLSQRITWANIKATLKTYLDTLYATLTGTATKKLRGTLSNPQAKYAQRAQLAIMRADAALTITRLYIQLNDSSPTAELAGDFKYADDQFDGSFANPVIIDVGDTTSGVFLATSGFDDATVPSGKEIYFQFDASPHVDIKEIKFEMFYTYD